MAKRIATSVEHTSGLLEKWSNSAPPVNTDASDFDFKMLVRVIDSKYGSNPRGFKRNYRRAKFLCGTALKLCQRQLGLEVFNSHIAILHLLASTHDHVCAVSS
jgi:hypothetical protein